MNIEGTTSITILTSLLTEIIDINKPISDTIIQQLFYSDRALMAEIVALKYRSESEESIIYLDEMAKQLAKLNLEISKSKPYIEEVGLKERLDAINEISSVIDRSQLLITKEIKRG